MKNLISVILLLATVVVFLAIDNKDAAAQSTVQVTVTGIPSILPSPFISDFERNVFNGNYRVTANVTGSGALNVSFRVRVALAGEILVDELSEPRELQPGFNNLTPFPQEIFFQSTVGDVLNNLPSSRVRQAYQTGAFPEGNYILTIEPVLASNNSPLGAPGFSTFTVLYPQPPILIAPFNNMVLAESVSVPVFSWSPVMGPPGTSFEYEFLMVELYDGQNPGDALLSNRQHAQMVRTNNLLPYTADNLPLELGKSYAWQITARDVNGEIPVKNEGRSEIYVFTFGDEDDEEDDEVFVATLRPQIDPTSFFLPMTTISGNVNWAFKQTEGAEGIPPVIPTNTQTLQTTNSHTVSNAIDDPNFVLGVDTDYDQRIFTDLSPTVATGAARTLSSEAGVTGRFASDSVVPVFGGGTYTAVDVGAISEVNFTIDNVTTHVYPGARVKAVVEGRGDLEDHVIATTTADEEGNFSLIFAPSELNKFVRTGSQTNMSAAEQELDDMVRAAEEDRRSDGIMQRSQSESAVNVPVKIVVDSEYFHFPKESTVNVNTNNAQSYSAGAMIGFARTYRFKPEVIHADIQSEIPEAVVEVFRQENWYNRTPEVRPEGAPVTDEDREEPQIINGRSHIKIAEMGSGGTITRLFPRKKGFMDRYLVRVSAEGYKTTTSHLSASPDLSVTNVVTINRTYSLEREDPIVEGRVLRMDNMAHMEGATVSLWEANENSPAYSAVTNNEGRFIISDIETSENPYLLRVSGSRISTYEEEIMLSQNGIVIERDPLLVNPSLITVVGSVINDEDVPVTNAVVRWQEGGAPVQTDDEGRFVTANTAGTHVLEVRKIGHRDEVRTITLQIDDEGQNYSWTETSGTWGLELSEDYVSTAGQWAGSVMNTQTFQQSSTPFNPGSSGYSGNIESQFGLSPSQTQTIINDNNLDLQAGELDAVTVFFSDLMGEDGTPGGIEDIGAIVMTRSVGRLLVTVEDEESNEPISDAIVSVGTSGLEGETNEFGEIFFNEAPGGTTWLKVGPQTGTNYVALATEITVSDAGDTTRVNVSMEIGGRAEGVVMAGGQPVENATVRVVGWEDTSTQTASDGSYVLSGVPLGYWELSASKSGYVGQIEVASFSANETVSMNFELGDAGFDISSLLGFEVEVDNVSISSDTTISGAFVSMQSNALFEIDQGLRLPFYDIKVFEENGELYPVDGEVVTDVIEIDATIFNYLYVKVKNTDGLVVRPRTIFSNNSFIAGRIEVNYASTFTSATGWSWPDIVDQYLTIPNIEALPEGIGENQLVAITNDGSFPFPDLSVTEFEFTFGSTGRAFNLFGFDLQLALSETVLRNDGIYTGGSIQLSDIPLLDEAALNLEKLWIGVDGSVREASFGFEPSPQLTLASWGLELNSGTITEAGIMLGGAMLLSIPGSDVGQFAFSKLGISGAQIHGGQFTFPVEGIDIFGIASLQTLPGKDITFGKVQGDNIYYVTGSAVIGLPRLIERKLAFKEFLIRTDGQFSANIAANFEADFYGLADISISGVGFKNTPSPEIRIDGQFGLHAIPFITAQTGGLTYRPGSVSVDEILLGFELVGVAEAQVGINFIDEEARSGFAGMGALAIHTTPINASVGFEYIRQPQGITFGAEFETGIPPIPIGTFAIDNIGGGFTYSQAESEYSVNINGRVSIGGVAGALSLDPLSVTVASGPVITGSADLTVMAQSVANANLTIDFPNTLFDLEAELTFDTLEDVDINVDRRARIVASGAEGDSYWMAGASMKAHLASLISGNANILAAWNLNIGAHPEYSQYTSFVEDQYIHNGLVTGAYLNAAVEFGVPQNNPACGSFLFVEACGYFWNDTQCRLSADAMGSQLGLSIISNWEGGGNLVVAGYDVISAEASAIGEVNGGYRNGVWSAYGLAEGAITGTVGSCSGSSACNSWCPPSIAGKSLGGRRFCGGAAIEVDYSSVQGMNISVELTEKDEL